MHMKKLASACALALGSLATGGAQAAVPFDPVQVDMFLSGASAVQNNFKAQLSNLFVAGYVTAADNTTSNGADFFAVTGTFKSAAPVPVALQGKTARITYRTRGGSVWGVDPVAREEQIQWMKMDSATCSTTPPPVVTTLTANYYCAPTGDDSGSNGRKSDLGVSDVEPKMFQGPLNVEFGKNQLSNFDLAGLKSSAVYQQAFGVPLTNAIPTSLFMNRPMVVSLVSKKTVSWLDIKGLGSTAVPADPINAINPGSSTTKPVVVCRRVQGSGTQATANFFINQFGCAGGAYVPPARMSESDGFGAQGSGASKADPIMIDPSYGYTVVENPGSGDVRNCLVAAQNGTNHTFKGDDGLWYQITFSGVGTDSATPTPNVIYTNGDPTVNAPFGAVGVLSYDSAGKEGTTWHFQDLSSVLTANAAAIDASSRPAATAPNISTARYALAAMMEGSWDYFSEVTMQYRNGLNGKTALTDTPPAVNPATGNYSTGALKTLADQLVISFGDPAVMNTLKSYKLGIAALPSTYTPAASVTTNLVSKGTKSGDTCAPNTLFFKPQFWQ